MFRGQSRPLKRAFPRRWNVPQPCPRAVAVMVIQLVTPGINDDKGQEALWRTKAELSRKDFVSAMVFGGLKGGESSSCAYVERRPIYD